MVQEGDERATSAEPRNEGYALIVLIPNSLLRDLITASPVVIDIIDIIIKKKRKGTCFDVLEVSILSLT